VLVCAARQSLLFPRGPLVAGRPPSGGLAIGPRRIVRSMRIGQSLKDLVVGDDVAGYLDQLAIAITQQEAT
jgi:hypothetical protein